MFLAVKDIQKVKHGIVFTMLLLLLKATPSAVLAGDGILDSKIDHLDIRGFSAPKAPVFLSLKRVRIPSELKRPEDSIKAAIYGKTRLNGRLRAAAVGPFFSDIPQDGPGETDSGSQPRTVSETTNSDFLLVVTGDPQAFKAVCIVIDRRGAKKRVRIEGHSPRSYGLDGTAADCRVDRIDQHAGTLSVEMYGRTSSLPLGTNSTNEAFGCVHVRSDGPWGKADGRRCSRAIRRF